jgi:cytidyltransferase-like protein
MKLAEGSVHGRFQPLHFGHLEYLMAAKKLCRFLWIGITQYDIHELTNSIEDPHRSIPINNPLTFFERTEMIINTLEDVGLKHSDYAIIPFPIEEPEKLHDFLPTNIPIITTICDDWNRYKIDLLRKLEYEVKILWERENVTYRGTEIRRLLKKNNDAWREMVPTATIKIIEKYQIIDRLKLL